MRNKRNILIIIIASLLFAINAEGGFKKPKWLEDTQKASKKALEDTQRAGKNARENIQRTGKNARENIQRTGKNARENIQRTGKNARENIQRAGKNARERAARRLRINRELRNTIEKIEREGISRRRDFNKQIGNIKSKTQATINNIEDNRLRKVDAIKQYGQRIRQELQQRANTTGRVLEKFNRDNPIDHKGIRSAIDAVKRSVPAEKLKQFGTRISRENMVKGFNNTVDYVESTKSAKQLKKWGKRVSTENIVKGFNNTVDHIESTEPAKELTRWGKKASVENIRKAVPNTIEYWESSDEGRTLNNLGKRVSVENISKGVRNTKDYLESSEVGKTLYRAGENVNDYIDVRATSTHKKVNAAMGADSVDEWFNGKVMGRDSRRRRPPTKDSCLQRKRWYSDFGYNEEQAAILEYFLYNGSCKSIIREEYVEKFMKDVQDRFSVLLEKRIEPEHALKEELIDQILLEAFDEVSYSYGLGRQKPNFSNGSLALRIDDASDDSDDGYYKDENGIYQNDSLEAKYDNDYEQKVLPGGGVVINTGEKKPKDKPKPTPKPTPPDTDIILPDTDDSESFARAKKRAEAKNRTKKRAEVMNRISNFKDTAKKTVSNFFKPLTDDFRRIAKAHKKLIDSVKKEVKQMTVAELKDYGKEIFEKYVLDIGVGLGAGAAKVVTKTHSAILDLVKEVEKKNFEHVKKYDKDAKQVPVPELGGYRASAHLMWNKENKTVWQGHDGSWYYHDKPDYRVESGATRVCRPSSGCEIVNNLPDKRPDTMARDILLDWAAKQVGGEIKDRIKSKAKDYFKDSPLPYSN